MSVIPMVSSQPSSIDFILQPFGGYNQLNTFPEYNMLDMIAMGNLYSTAAPSETVDHVWGDFGESTMTTATLGVRTTKMPAETETVTKNESGTVIQGESLIQTDGPRERLVRISNPSATEDNRSLAVIVKAEALLLVGAELQPVLYGKNRRQQIKRGKIIVLDGNHDRDGDGQKIYTPNWNKTAIHANNKIFIDAVTMAVSAVPAVKRAGLGHEMIQKAARTYFKRMRVIVNTQARQRGGDSMKENFF